MGNLGKRMKEAGASVEGKDNLSIEEAVSLVKGNAKAKFDETIEIAMNLGVDTRHADQMSEERSKNVQTFKPQVRSVRLVALAGSVRESRQQFLTRTAC